MHSLVILHLGKLQLLFFVSVSKSLNHFRLWTWQTPYLRCELLQLVVHEPLGSHTHSILLCLGQLLLLLLVQLNSAELRCLLAV
jgi:hypothetical protein